MTGLIKSEIKMADYSDLFGIKFEYKSARDSETSSLKYTRNEEMKPLTITKFDKVEYEEMVKEYYDYYSLTISRQTFKKIIVGSKVL